MNAVMAWMSLVAIVGCGVVGGIFFAFSSFIMAALREIDDAAGIAAMQAINRTVLNPWFFAAFFGTALVCLGLLIGALIGAPVWRPGLMTAAGLIYLVGVIGVTVVCNVPLNERLAKVDAASPEGTALWAHYLKRWTLWNHLRTLAGIVAAVLFLLTIL